MGNLLDTNVLSQWTKLKPDAGAVRWLRQVRPSELFVSVISLAEIRYGIEEMPAGRKRRSFEHWLANDIRQGFAGRILLVDERVAEEAGRLTSLAKKAGAKPDFADALIAATARIHGLRVATLNYKHFERLDVELVKF